MSLIVFSNRTAFFHAFLLALSILPLFQKQHFAVIKRIGAPQNISVLFYSNRMVFFHVFYVPFHLFKVPFDFSAVPNAAFCKAKVQRGTPKEGKRSVFFFSNRMAFFHAFLRAIFFFKVPFIFQGQST